MNKRKILFLAFAAMLVSITSIAQQATGAFIAMDGGMEGQSVGTLTKTSSSSKPTTVWSRSTPTGKTTINSIVSTGGRTGDKFLSINDTVTTTSSINVLSPYALPGSIIGGASYVVQFFYRATDGLNMPNTAMSVGVSNATATGATFVKITTDSSNPSSWVKSVTIVTAANGPIAHDTGFSVFKIVGSATNNSKAVDLDDWVVYSGTFPDTIAPTPPGIANISNPTSATLTLAWNASANVDSGGYLVVRYLSDPTGEPDPTVNGIYSIGNSIGLGTVAYTGTSLTFVDNQLLGNTNYWYRIYSVDKAFNYSTYVSVNGSTNGSLSVLKYYVDATNGNDANPGNSITAPWQTIAKVNSTKFTPGDSVLFKCGETWSGITLHPLGSGTSGRPIVISKYGTGNLPKIIADANGVHNINAVYLFNQQYITISNLDVTNDYTATMSDTVVTFGVHVVGTNSGTLRGITIKNMVVHDVTGAYGSKPESGGILCQVTGTSNVTVFDSLIIEGCKIYNVDRTGISTQSSWTGREINGDYGTAPWRPFTHVYIRNNRLDSVAGNSIIIRNSKNPIVEHNIVWKSGVKYTGNAIFTFNCDDATVQYNEVAFTVYNSGDVDASALDGDYRCHRTVFQYNYTHDNEGGFAVAVCAPTSGVPATFDDSTVFRYNISQNDGHHNGGNNNEGQIISVTGQTTNTFFYNNTIYSSNDFNYAIYHRTWGGSGSVYPDATYYYNNIFYINKKNPSFTFGGSTGNVFDYNLYYLPLGGSHPIDAHEINLDPQFVNPGSGDTGFASLSGYKLLNTSPCINSGKTIAGAPGYDFFNHPVPYNSTTDRGAFEYSGTVPVTLTMFRATAEGATNKLFWNTITEINNVGFEIEKSNNGKDFIPFAFVKTNANIGNSNLPLQYTFNDIHPYTGTTWYRLKQTDKNGAYQYSTIEKVINRTLNNETVVVSPNPVENHLLNLSISGNHDALIKVSLISESGVIVFSKEISNWISDKTYQIAIPERITKGFYVLKLEGNDFRKSINLIIK